MRNTEKIEDEQFNSAFALIQKYFREDGPTEDKDDISNLTLLDSSTNRSYKNSFFPIKRERIIENDKNGIFVPIATKNLFLKYYTKNVKEIMYWSSNDAKNYLEKINELLIDFLPNDNLNNDEQ